MEWEIGAGAPAGEAVTCAWSGGRLDVLVSKQGGELWYTAL